MFDRKQYDKDRYQRLKETRLLEIENYQKANLGKVRVSHRKWYFERKMKVLKLLGNECANPYNLPHPDWCNDWRCLQIDHVNGGGNKQRKKIGSTICFLSYVLKHPEEFQLLCSNCNWLKRYVKGEHA